MTSHAAVVARGMGKCCVSAANGVVINYKERKMTINGKVFNEGDWISLNGTTGNVYEGNIPTQDAELGPDFLELMKIADKYTRMSVRTNADTPHDAQVARNFGATGIGLCRTEHMFFEEDKIIPMREMILAKDEEGRRKALEKLLPLQKKDFKGIFAAMDGFPVTVRLLDPPLHEFVPHDEKGQMEMAKVMNISYNDIHERVESLMEANPMLGLRGCRLGNLYPEITEMQTRAIIEAALELKKEGITAIPEIMVPLTGIGMSSRPRRRSSKDHSTGIQRTQRLHRIQDRYDDRDSVLHLQPTRLPRRPISSRSERTTYTDDLRLQP